MFLYFSATTSGVALLDAHVESLSTKGEYSVVDADLAGDNFFKLPMAPNKLSPRDSAWDLIDQFFDTPHQPDEAELSDNWLDDLRAGWDIRFNDIYGTEERE